MSAWLERRAPDLSERALSHLVSTSLGRGLGGWRDAMCRRSLMVRAVSHWQGTASLLGFTQLAAHVQERAHAQSLMTRAMSTIVSASLRRGLNSSRAETPKAHPQSPSKHRTR